MPGVRSTTAMHAVARRDGNARSIMRFGMAGISLLLPAAERYGAADSECQSQTQLDRARSAASHFRVRDLDVGCSSGTAHQRVAAARRVAVHRRCVLGFVEDIEHLEP